MPYLSIGDGNRVWFWEDNWIASLSFLELFPHFYWLCPLRNTPIFYFLIAQGNQSCWNFHF